MKVKLPALAYRRQTQGGASRKSHFESGRGGFFYHLRIPPFLLSRYGNVSS